MRLMDYAGWRMAVAVADAGAAFPMFMRMHGAPEPVRRTEYRVSVPGTWHAPMAGHGGAPSPSDPPYRRAYDNMMLWWERSVIEAYSTGVLVFNAEDEALNSKAFSAVLREIQKLKDQGAARCQLEVWPVLTTMRLREGMRESERDMHRRDVRVVNLNDLDADTRYLGVPNGVVDLRRGAILTGEDAASAMVTAEAPDPFVQEAEDVDAGFVDQLFAHVEDWRRDYILDSFAYALHGRSAARRFNVLVGPAGGGKSTLLEAVADSLGPAYCKTLGNGALAPRRDHQSGNGPSPDMAALMPPTRIAYTPEMHGARIDVERLKSLTGGDTQSWRPLYGNTRTNRPTASLFLVGNDMPTGGIGAGDQAMEDRAVVIEYPSVPPDNRLPWMNGACRGKSDEARRRRQAVLQELLRRAVHMDPDQPPAVPEPIRQETARRLDAELGDLGMAIRASLAQGGATDRAFVCEFEAALVARCGEQDVSPTGDPRKDRPALYALVRRIHPSLPGRKRVVSPTGKREFAWEGWRVVRPEPDERLAPA